MPGYRRALPQLRDELFLTDGGIETTLIFHRGLELPDFAAFDLLRRPDGEAALRQYFRPYVELAKRHGTGLILESTTWRASADWGTRLGYGDTALADANRRAIGLLEDLRAECGADIPHVVISGCVGPRGDGYDPAHPMSPADAEAYHRCQIETFAETAADMVAAFTINYAEEAVGIAHAAQKAGMPVAISFTLETDGRLPTGQTLAAAITQVDTETSGYPAYYMINCAHPTHFADVLADGEPWSRRVRGLRANASRKSHAELNEAAELDTGDPGEFGEQHADLKRRLRHLTVMGGCCGTDDRHVASLAVACAPLFPSAGLASNRAR